MEMNNVWLSLRDGQSPVLYRNPDAELPARFVMSIGDALPAASASFALPARTMTITQSNNYHIINCQLHIAPSPAADYGNPSSPYYKHALSQKMPKLPTKKEIDDFCLDLYWEVIAPFSDVIVIFVTGNEPLRAADVLQRWARSPLIVSRFSPHILIVTEDHKDQRLKEVLHIFTRSVRGKLRITKIIRGSRVLPVISSLAEQSNKTRIKLKLNFSHRYRSFLVQTSLQNFCNNIPLQDFVMFSRLASPIPRSAGFYLQKVVDSFNSRIPELTQLIASALVLDAFPPGMHCKSDPLCYTYFTYANLSYRLPPKRRVPDYLQAYHRTIAYCAGCGRLLIPSTECLHQYCPQESRE